MIQEKEFIANVIHSCSNCTFYKSDNKTCAHDPMSTTIWYNKENEGIENTENECVRFESV